MYNTDGMGTAMALGLILAGIAPGVIIGALAALIVWISPYHIGWSWIWPWAGGAVTLTAGALWMYAGDRRK